MDRLRLLDGRLKLRHLVLVDVLTEHGSVIAAAEALHITQPVATRTLRDLEAILGVSLYERGPRGVTPTIFGETFTRHARAILTELTQAGRHVAELADANRGTVVVGTDAGGAHVLLLRAIARLKMERPQLTVVIRESAPRALSLELCAGQVDLIVGWRAGSANEAEVGIPIYTEPIGIFTRKSHPLTARHSVAFADLQGYPWVVPGVEAGMRRDAEHLFGRHGLSLPANRVEVTSLEAMRQLLLESDLVALLPASIAQHDPALCPLPVPLNAVKSTIAVTTPVGRTVNPGAQLLVQVLQKLAAEDVGSAAGHDFPAAARTLLEPSRAS